MRDLYERLIVQGWGLAGLLGALAYIAVAGFAPLDVTNIAWIFEKADIATAQTGWTFYRFAPWSPQIALNPAYGMDFSGSILFSDAVPLFAILFKALSPILPEQFQYFGLWTFTSFVLQGVFGWVLMSRATENPYARLLGACLLLLTPLYVYRLVACTHMSLSAHWPVLAALCLCLPPHTRRPWLWWGLLLAGAAFMHVYIFAMVAALYCADLARRAWLDVGKTWPEPIALVAALGALIAATGIWAGPAGEAQGGFGWFKMNVFSFLDPNPWTGTPLDRPGWSLFMPDLPNWGGDYEGFAYLGLGGLLLAAITLWALPRFAREHAGHLRPSLPYLPFWLCLIGMGVFALSQNVTFANFNLYLWWPSPLQSLGELFRSTGRFIWPLYYFCFFVGVYVLARRLQPRTLLIALAGVALVQAYDTAPGWLHDRPYLHQRGPAQQTALTSPFWTEAAARYRAVRLVPHDNARPDYLNVALMAFDQGLETDAVYLSRTSTPASHAARARMEHGIATGEWPGDAFYVLDEEVARRASATLDPGRDFLARVDGYIVLAPGWQGCAECGAAPYR